MPIEPTSLEFIRTLVARGGPDLQDYSQLDFILCLHKMSIDGTLTAEDISILHEALGSALSQSTMQGFALAKPHGYAGDFEIIDRIYQHAISSDPNLARWGAYYH